MVAADGSLFTMKKKSSGQGSDTGDVQAMRLPLSQKSQKKLNGEDEEDDERTSSQVVLHISHSGSAKHTLAISTDGVLYGWGSNAHGQLGIPIHDGQNAMVPVPIELQLPKIQSSAILSRMLVSSVAVGKAHSIIICRSSDDGMQCVYGMGSNEFGQLGTGSHSKMSPPTAIRRFSKGFGDVKAKDEVRVTNASAGARHTLFLTSTGRVFACGDNRWGQAGQQHSRTLSPSTLIVRPEPIPSLYNRKVNSIAAGDMHSAVLTDRGEVFMMGKSSKCGHSVNSSEDGQDGSTAQTELPACVPMVVTTLQQEHVNVISIACSPTATFAVSRSGEVWAWGYGHGEGEGSSSSSSSHQLNKGRISLSQNPKSLHIRRALAKSIDRESNMSVGLFSNNTKAANILSEQVVSVVPGDDSIIFRTARRHKVNEDPNTPDNENRLSEDYSDLTSNGGLPFDSTGFDGFGGTARTVNLLEEMSGGERKAMITLNAQQAQAWTANAIRQVISGFNDGNGHEKLNEGSSSKMEEQLTAALILAHMDRLVCFDHSQMGSSLAFNKGRGMTASASASSIQSLKGIVGDASSSSTPEMASGDFLLSLEPFSIVQGVDRQAGIISALYQVLKSIEAAYFSPIVEQRDEIGPRTITYIALVCLKILSRTYEAFEHLHGSNSTADENKDRDLYGDDFNEVGDEKKSLRERMHDKETLALLRNLLFRFADTNLGLSGMRPGGELVQEQAQRVLCIGFNVLYPTTRDKASFLSLMLAKQSLSKASDASMSVTAAFTDRFASTARAIGLDPEAAMTHSHLTVTQQLLFTLQTPRMYQHEFWSALYTYRSYSYTKSANANVRERSAVREQM